LVPELEKVMDELCKNLNLRFGTDEFHFTDMYNHKNKFSNIKIEETLEILETFAELFQIFDLKIFVSTMNSYEKTRNYQSLLNGVEFLTSLFNLPNNEKSKALLMTYIKAKVYVKDDSIDEIICDEGLRNAGIIEKTPNESLKMKFESSKSNRILQLADYAAWFVTRAKNIMDKVSNKKMINDIDRRVLEIYASLENNYVNLKKNKINLDDLSQFSYDKIIDNFKKNIND